MKTVKYIIEWREHGRWVRSLLKFDTKLQCKEHAQMIGAHKYRLVKKTTTETIVNQ